MVRPAAVVEKQVGAAGVVRKRRVAGLAAWGRGGGTQAAPVAAASAKPCDLST